MKWKIKKLPSGERKKIHDSLHKQVLDSSRYYTLLILSVIIATLGLVSNNSPVVMGAMLISPIMSPVLATSIAMASGRLSRFKSAMDLVFQAIFISLVISTIIGIFSPIIELPNAVTVRSSVTLLDLLIALTAGLAGAYSLIRKDVHEAIPGVAISVSLLPPLTAVGIALSVKNFIVALGAMLMFMTNLVAIMSAGVVVAFLYGFRPVARDDKTLFKSGAIVSGFLIIFLAFILSTSFYQATRDARVSKQIKDVLTKQITYLTAGELESFQYIEQVDYIEIEAIIRSKNNLSSYDMEILTNALAYSLEESVKLKISVITIQEGGRIVKEEEKIEIKKDKEEKDSGNVILQLFDASSSADLLFDESTQSAEENTDMYKAY